ncbi:MAG: FAD-dependent oxidoreductase [Thermomicrobiales bacterium]
MNALVILTVAEDASTLERLSRDLERRFGADYRVIAAQSATHGLATLGEILAADGEVTIVLASQRLPEMTGIDFLDQADDLCRTARRGILVAPGPGGLTVPIRRAMLFGHLDFQIIEPWVSPEEWVYPTISEQLSIWTREHRPHDEAITIVDRQWGPRGHELRDILERSGVPYGSYAADSSRGRELVAKYGLREDQLPVVIHRSGTVLANPSNEALAEVIGVATQPPAGGADVAIIGAGPAGLAAAVYGASEGLRTVVVEAAALGGQAATSNLILNYLGFPRGLSGRELTTRSYFQALLFGARFVFMRRAVELRSDGEDHVLTFDNGTTLRSRAVVVTGGVAERQLDVPTAEPLAGRGVFYGATAAEAEVLAGEEIFVVGGGNAAAQATLHLAKYAARVTLLVRGNALVPGMSDYLVQSLQAAENVAVRLNTRVVDAVGGRRLRGLVLKDGASGEREHVPGAALFVEIGGEPHTDWLPPTVARDERGFVLTGREIVDGPGIGSWPLERLPRALETSLPGVFAAGDVRHGAMNRVASAVGEGALAIRSAHDYLEDFASELRTPAPAVSAPGAP